MQVSVLGPEALLGMNATGSTSGLPVGPMGGDTSAAPGENVVSLSNPGDGIAAESLEPLPPHIDSGGPAAVAAPAPERVPMGPSSSNEPTSLYQPPMQKG